MSIIHAQGKEENVRVGKVFLGEDGIVRMIQVPELDLTLEDAQECVEALLKVRQGKRHPLLIDARRMRSISRDARQYFASDEVSKLSLAFAMIVDTPLSRILANFYMGLNKPQLPSRLFASEAEAVEWLQGYIE